MERLPSSNNTPPPPAQHARVLRPVRYLVTHDKGTAVGEAQKRRKKQNKEKI